MLRSILIREEGRLMKLLEQVISFFFCLILLLTILLVVLRYLFNSSIMGGNELMGYLFIYTTSLGAAVSICKNEHIRISYFVDLLPQSAQRLVNALNYLLVALINLVIAWLSYSWISQVGQAPSPVMRIPMWIVEISVPIGCLFVVLFCLSGLVRLFLPAGEERS